MSRRVLRTSLLNKSSLVKHISTEAFLFDSEPIKDPVSPNTCNLPASAAEKKSAKKGRQRKIIRYTEDLNVLMTDDGDSNVSSKTKSKSKRTKKTRLPSFLPAIDILDENKKRPLASGNNTTDSENKENENNREECLQRAPRSSRRKKRVPSLSENSPVDSDAKDNGNPSDDIFRRKTRKPKRKKNTSVRKDLDQAEITESQKTAPSLSENSSIDSDAKDNGNQSDGILKNIARKLKRKKKTSVKKDQANTADEDQKTRPSLSGSSTDTDEKVIETIEEGISEAMPRRSIRKKNSLVKKGLGQSNNDSKKEQLQDNTIGTTSARLNSSSRQTTSKTTLRREGTFEISPQKSCTPRETLDVSSSRLLNGETVDLTESVAEIAPSPRKVRRTFDKDPIDNGIISLESDSNSLLNGTFSLSPVKKVNRSTIKLSSGSRQSSFEISSVRENKTSTGPKSSFEISFNKEPKTEQVLDHLNITRRDSHKKSSTGMQSSTEIEDDKGKFITLRRQCRSLIDFEAANSLNDSLHEKGSTLKRSKASTKLNKEMEEKNDVSLARKNLAEHPSPRKGILKSGRFTRDFRKNTTFEATDGCNEALEMPERPSVVTKFQITEATPNKSQQVVAYRDIFDVVVDTPTVDLRDMLIDNVDSFALANSVVNNTNMSMMPKLNRTNTFTIDVEVPKKTPLRGRSSARKRWSQVEKTPVFDKMPPFLKNDSQLDANTTVTKSVRFGTSPPNLSVAAQSQVEDRKSKAKKSVKIESPLITPKMRLHSPLVMRKTPKPDFNAGDNSILASNCAYSSLTLMSPSSSSTPFPKKKEASLRNEVLTNEKSKAEKAIKSSSRVKMPNFRKIHERQFEKMENIKELQERKAMRAQYLMSGCKIPSAKNTPGDEPKDSRKKLLFSPSKTVESNKKGRNTPKTALPKIIKPEFKKRASLDRKKNELKSKLPVMLKNLNSLKAGELQTISQQSGIMKNISKPQQHMLYKRASLDKKKPERKPETKPLSRFGFKLGVQVTKEAQIKALAAKSKLTVNRTEQNRKHGAAVRTNRRFELLMQFREKK